jgi:hypothetical protein
VRTRSAETHVTVQQRIAVMDEIDAMERLCHEFTPVVHPRKMCGNRIAQRFQQGGEKAVQLKAPTASAAPHDLIEKLPRFQTRSRSVFNNIKIFKRNAALMRKYHLVKRSFVRNDPLTNADPVQVLFYVLDIQTFIEFLIHTHLFNASAAESP